jgi:excisionase family DNA binding protein
MNTEGATSATVAGRIGVGGEPEYYRVREVCRRLTLSRNAVYNLMSRGELGYATFGRCRRVSRADLESFIRRQTVRGAASTS